MIYHPIVEPFYFYHFLPSIIIAIHKYQILYALFPFKNGVTSSSLYRTLKCPNSNNKLMLFSKASEMGYNTEAKFASSTLS